MEDPMCAVWCNACSTGDREACQGVRESGKACRQSCPAWLMKMGDLQTPPLTDALESFVADRSNWADEAEAEPGGDRDARYLRALHRPASGRETMHGGALARHTHTYVAPHREDRHGNRRYVAPRYVPIGFARFSYPGIDPQAYTFIHTFGGMWRVAIPAGSTDQHRAWVLAQIARLGPQGAGFVYVGDTLVPASLGPGDQWTLAQAVENYPLSY
jgi:hypothetical protein